MTYGWDDIEKSLPREASEGGKEMAHAIMEADGIRQLMEDQGVCVDRFISLAGRSARLRISLEFQESNPEVPESEEGGEESA